MLTTVMMYKYYSIYLDYSSTVIVHFRKKRNVFSVGYLAFFVIVATTSYR